MPCAARLASYTLARRPLYSGQPRKHWADPRAADARKMLVTAFSTPRCRASTTSKSRRAAVARLRRQGPGRDLYAAERISHAALYLHVDGDKLFYDGDKKKLLAPGELGNALAEARRPNKVVVAGASRAGSQSRPPCATAARRDPSARRAPTATPSSPLCPPVPGAPLAALHGVWC